ncbi:MAG: tetratricopeptide repeat protein [Deltaproteobacteria bacterium]|nr:tetratricopeptide repeat protein [Deltaproteobacteria bacterium]
MKNLKTPILIFLLASLCACGIVKIDNRPEALSVDERLELASIYLARGEHELAKREYSKVIETDKTSALAYFGMGNVYLKLKDFKEAESNYLKAIRIEPANSAFYNNLAWAFMEQGEYGKAGNAAKMAIDGDRERDYIYLDTLGVIQTRQKKFLEAEETFLNATNRDRAAKAGADGLKEIYDHLLELYTVTGEDEKALSLRDRLKGL